MPRGFVKGGEGCSKIPWVLGILIPMKQGYIPHITLTTLQGKTIYALRQNFLFRGTPKFFLWGTHLGQRKNFAVWVGKENFVVGEGNFVCWVWVVIVYANFRTPSPPP
ncbi:hypothetical protein HRbin15_02366 [bacterium HR15]|nr:hypothetical protein HRbin15_02366 [bacterium HR15]